MKRNLISVALVLFLAFTFLTLPSFIAETINVDGDPSDWFGVPPLVSDDAGDMHPDRLYADLLDCYVTDDGTNFYFRMDLNGAGPDSTKSFYTVLIDIDQSALTGSTVTGYIGADYKLDAYDNDYYLWTWDGSSWTWPPKMFNAASNTDLNFYEWSVPFSDLGYPFGQSIDLIFKTDTGLYQDYAWIYEIGKVTYTRGVAATTGTGTVNFYSDVGTFQDLTPVDAATLPSPPAGVNLPHGLFSFTITGLPTGQPDYPATVTVTIILPSAVPVGYKWYKYDASVGWISQPIGSDNGDNVITVTITDDGTRDFDLTPGVIQDPGGPGNPRGGGAVGGEVFIVDKLTLLTPYITIAVLITAAILVKKRKH